MTRNLVVGAAPALLAALVMVGLLMALLPAAVHPATAQPRASESADPSCTALTAAQLTAQVIGAPLRAPQPDDAARRLVAEHAGTVVLLGPAIDTAGQVSALVQALDDAAPTGLPPLIAVDEEGGRVARFGRAGLTVHLPSARAQAAGWTPAEVRDAAEELGRQLAGLGVDWDLGPVLDLTDAPADGVIGDRSYSADPAVAGTYAAAFAQGLRSAGMVTTGKHFPDHGLTTTDTHTAIAHVEATRGVLLATSLQPYRQALPDLDAIMLSHLRVSSLDPSLPATLSPAAVAMIRQDLGFTGAIVTDDLSMQAVRSLVDQPTAGLMAMQAGVDVLLAGSPEAAGAVHARLLDALADGTLSLERLRQAVRRALALKGITGPSASCLLGLPPVGQATLVADGSGTAWVLTDGVRQRVPDPQTLASLRLPLVAYSDAEVASLPMGPDLPTIRRFRSAVIAPQGADVTDLAVLRAQLDDAVPAPVTVVAADPRPWAMALAAQASAGSVPILPPAETARMQSGLDRIAAPDAALRVVGSDRLEHPAAADVYVIDTSDPTQASIQAFRLTFATAGGAPPTILVAAPEAPLGSLLVWLADPSTALLLTPSAQLDPRVAAVLEDHDTRVVTLGVAQSVTEQVRGTPLEATAGALVGWLHRSGWTADNVLVAADDAMVLASMSLAVVFGAVPVVADADGQIPVETRAAIGGWHLPPGATQVLFGAGVDPEPLLGVGRPTYVSRWQARAG